MADGLICIFGIFVLFPPLQYIYITLIWINENITWTEEGRYLELLLE